MSSSATLQSVLAFLESFAPLRLAEEWDNVGLLLGDRKSNVSRVMTCLTITPEVVEEAKIRSVDLIVSHHPMPFRSMKKITTDSVSGKMVLELIQNRISVFSPHTAFDSAASGINQSIAEKLSLNQIKTIQPAEPSAEDDEESGPIVGVGRVGKSEPTQSAKELCEKLKGLFGLDVIKFCGDLDADVSKIGIACGSAGQFLSEAARLGCNAFITGETNFHTCLESLASGVSLFLLGHYGSERFAVEMLAEKLTSEFPHLSIHASVHDKDPIQYIN